MTHSDVILARRLFRYAPTTGALRWRVDRVVALRNHSTTKAKAGSVAGWSGTGGYRYVMFKNRKRRATAIIWLIVHGREPQGEIDHKDCDGSNDRLRNLREATSSQNKCNTKIRADNKSGYKGVCWNEQNKKWRATIKIPGRQIHLGFFSHVAEAGRAYAAAAPIYHGDFARVR